MFTCMSSLLCPCALSSKIANFPALKCRTVSPSNLHLSAVPRYDGSFGLVDPLFMAEFFPLSWIFCFEGELARPKFPDFADEALYDLKSKIYNTIFKNIYLFKKAEIDSKVVIRIVLFQLKIHILVWRE